MIKVKRSSLSLRNALTFIFLSLVFLAAVQSIVEGLSLFSTKGVLFVLLKNYLTITLGLVTLYTVFNFYKFSKYVLLSFVVIVTFKSFLSLSVSFNKLALAFDFIYLMFAFYFYTDWELFLDAAATSPNFTKFDLEKESRFPIKGELQIESNVHEFRLTNLDEKGCFVLFNEASDIKLGSKYKIKIRYENNEFQSSVNCVSLYEKGAGFSFEAQKTRRDLSGLYQVCLERGIFN